jgi:acyl-CoA synthetase (AMP-forming)/AMP-acid ligase II
MNIAGILLQRAAQMVDSAAILDVHRARDRCYSFRELDQAAAAIAAQLHRLGLKQGDGVLLLHPVAAELYLLLIAVFRLGCVAMFLDPSAGRAHVERCCAIFPPKAFFGNRRAHLLRLTLPALRQAPKALCFEWFPGTTRLDLNQTANTLPDIALVSNDDPALITFTSGSTGEPKAAMRTHGFLLAQHRALQQSLHLQPGTRDLTTLPIFVLANLASGVTSILPDADLRLPGAINPLPVLSQLKRHSITTTAASPAFMSRILDACEESGTQITGLQRISLGGAPVFPSILHRTRRLCPHAVITAVYGSTEAEPMAEISLADISSADFQSMRQGKGLLAGRRVPSISLRVIHDQWGEPIPPLDTRQFEQMTTASEEPGEIVVSGEHVLSGYLGGVGDAESKFEVEGTRWHRTGDLGYLDADGRLWLLGRSSEKIQDERGTLYPFAVECAAMENPSIRRVAVVSIAGRRVLAVEAATTIGAEEIRRSLAWAQLDQVIFLDRVPVDKRHNAKIDYPALRRKLANLNRP